MDVHVGGSVRREAALEQVRDAAGKFHDLLAAGDLAQGIVQDLAVLGRDDGREFVLAGVQQLAECEEDLGAAGERGVAPSREGGLGGGNGGIAFNTAAEHNLSGHLSSGGVRDGGCAVPCGDVGAVDPVLDRVQGFSSVLFDVWRHSVPCCASSLSAAAQHHKGQCVKNEARGITLCKCCPLSVRSLTFPF